MASDEELIRAVLAGEVDRYGELVERYRSASWRMAFGFVGNNEDAKDLSQNGFVKAYQQLRRFQGRAKFSTWLYRIIANECKDFLRRKVREPQALPLPSDPEEDRPALFDLADPGRDPGEAASDRELAKALTQAIGRLSMKQRTVFILHHLSGLTIEKVAEVMRIRPGTVKAHLFRATETLRTALEPLMDQEVRT